ncbi:hypothetical protein MAR_003110 [Mya arenaria]|uniref:Uncharacterized protein n=1 Tax=Mya arenaria TaxID=6604 RepID=A0ABY7G527_MYAAR|nr:hypothetical protein MAR_003110 [Mya arenaria]
MCVGCMRNWQYNPVKCHSCKQPKINSPVGDRWGAILIAGTDKKPDVRKRFEDDIAKLKDKLITEVTVMGVREKNVITVTKSSTQYDEQLKKAFNQIDTSDINTLVLCYSGHHGDARFELDSENGKYLEDADLISNMNKLKHVEKIVLFLDCCFPKILDLSCEIVLQLNAVKVSEQASCESKGSQYINEIVDAVTNPCELECCNNTQIIREYDLHTHLSRYRDRHDHTQPSCQIVTGREIDRILAFRPVRSGWLNVLEKSLKSSKLQVLKTRLIKYILHAYSTIPLNPILQHKHSKLVDFYEPTKMTTTIEETEHKDSILDLSHYQLETLILDAINIKEVVTCSMETCTI